MSGDVLVRLIELAAVFLLGWYAKAAVVKSTQHMDADIRDALRAVDINDAAEDDEPLPYRPPADPYRFTYDQALRDIKPAADKPTAAPAGESPRSPAGPGLSPKLTDGGGFWG